MNAHLILASESPYRKQLLRQLGISFTVSKPGIDESRMNGEDPRSMVLRLAVTKAMAVAAANEPDSAWILAADQVACIGDTVFGKPGDETSAREMLHRLSGQEVYFITGVCLLAPAGNTIRDLCEVRVRYRELGNDAITTYLQREPEALYCAAAMRSEGDGMRLLAEVQDQGPGSIIGLPLNMVSAMLRQAGFNPG